MSKESSSTTTRRRVTMEQVRVGGPLVGNKPHEFQTDIPTWDKFEPIITPEITLDTQKPQRFVLLPHDRFISVIAYNTGKQLGNLIPTEAGYDDSLLIECVCLAKYPEPTTRLSESTVLDVLDKMDVDDNDNENNQQTDASSAVANDLIVVMAGCNDGTIREFSLKSVTAKGTSATRTVQCGPYSIPGPCYRPRRVIQLATKDPIMFITAPDVTTASNDLGIADATLVYVLTRTAVKNLSKTYMKDEQVFIAISRLVVNPYDGTITNITLSAKDDEASGTKKQQTIVEHLTCQSRQYQKRFINSTPFTMVSTVKPVTNKEHSYYGRSQLGVFVVVARATSIHIYYEQIGSAQRFQPICFPIGKGNPLTSVDIAMNQRDIARGHYLGQVVVMNDVLVHVEKYHLERANLGDTPKVGGGGKPARKKSKTNMPHHNLASRIVASTVHWHSHPVVSLAYDPISSHRDPLLYSGGEEAVLATWQISTRGFKPIDVLPRLALGGIVHISCSNPLYDSSPCDGILVYCEDNSLQLLKSHDKGRVWKIQGVGYNTRKGGRGILSRTRVEVDPRGNGKVHSQLVITGAPEAQGYMQWYDPRKQRISETLEVVPFNKISRADHWDAPLPSPVITNHVFSNGGQTLVTVDRTHTDNVLVGPCAKDQEGRDVGIVTTIRFWSLNDSQQGGAAPASPYRLAAAMTYPHGQRNRVTSLAVTKDGSMACTVSNDEKAFRLWENVAKDVEQDEKGGTRVQPSWTCRFKVTIPAGFNNMSTSRDGIAFSDDCSTMAICFGSMVTMWDTREGRHLTSLCHLDCANRPIDSIQFISTGLVKNFLLIKSASGVSMQSPIGWDSGVEGWKWVAPTETEKIAVTGMVFVESHAAVGISMSNSETGENRLIFVDAASGELRLDDDFKLGEVEGSLESICANGKYVPQSNWDKETSSSPPLMLYSLTTKGDLVLFRRVSREHDGDASPRKILQDESTPKGPTLPVAKSDDTARKRVRQTTVDSFPVTDGDQTAKKRAVEILGLVYAEENNKAGTPGTADLPALSRNFVRAFVGRSLSRNAKGGAN